MIETTYQYHIKVPSTRRWNTYDTLIQVIDEEEEEEKEEWKKTRTPLSTIRLIRRVYSNVIWIQHSIYLYTIYTIHIYIAAHT